MSSLNNSFSVVIPVHNRELVLPRAIQSVFGQNYNNWEIVIVNDGSQDSTVSVAFEAQLENMDKVHVISRPERKERVYSRNEGMKACTKDWICWLDSDDEYSSRYFEILNDAINLFPEYKIFNFGSIVQIYRNPNECDTKIRQTFRPAVLQTGHEDFKSGQIGTGSFIFHKSIFDEIPLMTPSDRPYGDPGCFPELNRNPNYGQNENGQWLPFGNPWGDDYMWFWLMTRKFHSKPLDISLYIQNMRQP